MLSYPVLRRDVAAGMRAMVPWLVGVLPFGLVIGVSAAQADIPTFAGWLTGPTIYAGSSQVATIAMLNAGAGPLAVIATALVINVRLVFYSAAMARYWRGTPLWWRLLGGYLLIDPSFAVGIARYAEASDRRRAHAHYLGGAIVLWASWLVAIGVGAAAGEQIPTWLHLEFLIPLYLIGEIVPKMHQTTVRTAVLVTAAVAVLGLAAPMHAGIALAIIAGIATGSMRKPRGHSETGARDRHPTPPAGAPPTITTEAAG